MSEFALHLTLSSVGLAVAVALGALVLRRWRLQPVRSYQLLVALLAATLFLPAAQLGVQRLWPASSPLFGNSLTSWLQAESSEAPVSDEAPRVRRRAPVTAPTRTDDSGRLALVPPRVSSELVVIEERTPEREPVDEPSPLATIEAPLLFLPGASLPTERASTPTVASTRSTLPSASTVFTALTWIYVGGVLLALLRLARRLHRTYGILARSRRVEDETTRRVWRQVRSSSPAGARTRLHASDEIQAPACFGLIKNTIVVPAEAPSLDDDALGLALVHELVHLERRDTWTVLLQELLGCLLWFHPAAWWLKRRLDSLREISCDWIVVKRTGRRRRYAQALLDYADALCRRPRTPAATLLPWTTSPSQLTRRIEMLVSESQSSNARRRKRSVVLSLGAFTALFAGQLTLAAHMTTEPHEPQQPHAPHPSVKRTLPDGIVVPALPTRPAPPTAASPSRVRPATPIAPVAQATVPSRLGPPALATAPAPTADLRLGLEPLEPLLTTRAPEPPAFPGLALQDDLHHMGIRLEGLSEVLAEQLGVDADGAIVIRSVYDDSPAEDAGLRAFDVIVRVNGEDATQDALTRARRELTDGDEVELRIVRRGDKKTIVVRPSEDGDGWMVDGQGMPSWFGGHADDPEVRQRVDRARSLFREAQREHHGDSHEAQELFERARELQRHHGDDQHHGERPRVLLRGGQNGRFNLERALEQAQRYYDAPDKHELRIHLQKALENVQNVEQYFENKEEYQDVVESLREILEGDMQTYVDSVRTYLDSVDSQEFQGDIFEALKKQGIEVHRRNGQNWGQLFPQHGKGDGHSGQRRGWSFWSNDDDDHHAPRPPRAPRVRVESRDRDDAQSFFQSNQRHAELERLQAELQETQRELSERQRELAELRREIERMNRRGGAR